MSNTIKLKRGSGSDPSASDLSIGEIAIRTDSGKLFTKKDNGSVAEISGSGGIDDGDKGDITVSNGGDTFTIDSGVVTTAKIAQDAVDFTKLQNISTNVILGRNDAGTGITKQLSTSEVRTLINVEDGATADQTASEILTLLKTVDGSGSGLDADTLDGVSSASFLRSDAADTCSQPITFSSGIILPTTGEVIKFGPGTAANDDAHIEWLGGSNAGYLRFSTSDDSDSSGSNEYIEFGDYPTQNRVGTFTQHVRISRDRFLVRTGSNSITQADRLNIDDAGTVDIYGNLDIGAGCDVTGNITVTGTVDGRDVATDGTKLDGIESNATADQTASEIVALVADQTIAPSTIDMEDNEKILLGNSDDLQIFHDGNHSRIKDTGTGDMVFHTNTIAFRNAADSENIARFNQDGACELYQDNVLRLNTSTSGITVTGDTSCKGNILLTGDATTTNQDRTIQFTGFDKEGTTDFTDNALIRHTTNTGGLSGSVLLIQSLNDSNDGIAFFTNNHNNNLRLNGNIIWNAGNDGSGSGLDADTLDGVQGSSFLRSDATDTASSTITFSGGINVGGSGGGITGSNYDISGVNRITMNDPGEGIVFKSGIELLLIDDSNDNILNFNGAAELRVNNSKVWTASNDGSGSGLDSDLLDGQEGSYYRNASNLNAGTIPAARVPTLNQNTTGSAATLTTARTIAGVSFNGSANISLNNNAITNGAGYITSSDSSITNKLPLAGGTMSGDLNLANNVLYFSDANTSNRDHIWSNDTDNSFNFCHDTTRKGTANSILKAASFQGSGASLTSLNASNITSGTIPSARLSASDLLTLIKTVDGAGSGLDAATLNTVSSSQFLRSDTADTASGDITFSGGAGAATIAANSDIRFTNGTWTGSAVKIQQHSNRLYIAGGSSGIRFREGGTDRWDIDGSGHFIPATDSTYDIGSNGTRVRNGYFDTLYGDGSNLTGISAGATGGGSDEVFYENDQTVTTNYTITNGKNAMAAGPITINSGVTVTVGSGETLTIV